jgi:DMATS type aromatic prenyltransferase
MSAVELGLQSLHSLQMTGTMLDNHDCCRKPQVVSLTPTTACENSLETKQPPTYITPAWHKINQEILGMGKLQEQAHLFWWHSTGVTFAILLQNARYSFKDQCQHLVRYYTTIIPELGAGPSSDGSAKRWKSFMTDHHCPVEFSWEWNHSTELAVIRCSFEAIGAAAGTSLDPYNQYATLQFVDKARGQIAGCDLHWFDNLWETLTYFEVAESNGESNAPSDHSYQPPSTHQSRSFLALEFKKTGLVLKAYFLPEFRARAEGSSSMSVISEAFTTLPNLSDTMQSAYQDLKGFLETSPQGQTLLPEIVAIDCVAPQKSRFKIYMRSHLTTLESVIETLSLSDSTRRNNLQHSITDFTKVWNAVFGLDPDQNDNLPRVDHRTSGILYCFSLEADKATPTVKVYLPVRHYGKGDREVAAGLQSYVRTTARTDYSQAYVEAIDEIR